MQLRCIIAIDEQRNMWCFDLSAFGALQPYSLAICEPWLIDHIIRPCHPGLCFIITDICRTVFALSSPERSDTELLQSLRGCMSDRCIGQLLVKNPANSYAHYAAYYWHFMAQLCFLACVSLQAGHVNATCMLAGSFV